MVPTCLLSCPVCPSLPVALVPAAPGEEEKSSLAAPWFLLCCTCHVMNTSEPSLSPRPPPPDLCMAPPPPCPANHPLLALSYWPHLSNKAGSCGKLLTAVVPPIRRPTDVLAGRVERAVRGGPREDQHRTGSSFHDDLVDVCRPSQCSDAQYGATAG